MSKIKEDGLIINLDGTGELNLSSAHSMVMGHVPNKVTSEQVQKKLNEDSSTVLESFGLFEQATPNYTTYYPDVTADDLNPKDEEFIEPLFRLLSETIVSKGFRPIDFSKPGVLKKSMQMLLGQTINIDHEIAVGNAIGAVSEVYWQPSYKTKSGITVPAGINGKMKIDGKSNPRIARGIMMTPPSIHSNSVTVRFKWEPSHKFEESSEFYQKLGTYDDKGQLVRLVVTEVIGYSETSLVSHGADMWAQKINEDREIVNPEYADRQSFSVDTKANFTRSCVEIDYKTELSFTADNSIPGVPNIKNTNPNNSDMDKLIQELETSFGFEKGTLTAENLSAKVAEVHSQNLTQIQTLTQENGTLKTEKETAEGKVTQLQADLDTANANKSELDNFTAQTQNEAVRLYKLALGEKADENILALIGKADLKTSQSFVQQYTQQVDEKFAQTCTDCGSKNINRASAEGSNENLNGGESGNPGGTDKPKSRAELKASLASKKKRNTLFNGETNEG